MEQARTRREAEVWQVCDDLWAQKGEWGALTGDAIRDKLVQLGYKRGSPNEIYKYRHTWKLSRHIVTVPEGGLQTETAAAADPISRAVAMVKEELRLEANQVIEAQAADFEAQKRIVIEECEQLKAQLKEYTEKIEGLEQVLAENRQYLAEEKQIRQETENHLQDARQLGSLMQGRLDKAEEQVRHQALLYAENLKELKETHAALCDTLRANLATAKQEHAKELTRLMGQLKEQGEKSMDESNALKLQIRQLEHTASQISSKKEALEAENTRVYGLVEKADLRAAQLTQENAQLHQEIARLREESVKQHEWVQVSLQTQRQQAAEYSEHIAFELKRLSEQLDKLQPATTEVAAG